MKRLFYIVVAFIINFTGLNLYSIDVSDIRSGLSTTANPFFNKKYKIAYSLSKQPVDIANPSTLFVFIKVSTSVGTTLSVWQVNQEDLPDKPKEKKDTEKLKNIKSDTKFLVMKNGDGSVYKYKFVLPTLPKFIRVNFLDYVNYWKIDSISGQTVNVSIPAGNSKVSGRVSIVSSKLYISQNGDISSWKAGQMLVPFVMKDMNSTTSKDKVTGDQAKPQFTVINTDTNNYVTCEFIN